ncbi:FHA domain-containing protein [Haloimpatiens lingqiaonensis]|uniref:FHA domain-containing protein n=1 Tax=Haloimpatiens lingqiaonensis TaxID=1380675 RepID=UPI0010FCF91C|nr:FHA domain-containing protein [Haloimpatiens lingqiaonensis]
MDLSKFSFISKIFTIAIIAIIYVIIFFILKIMYKDIKDTGRRKKGRRKKYGLEVIEIKGNEVLKEGSVIPMGDWITIGRKEDNTLVLADEYVSGYHAKIFLKNNSCVIEDLNSTNGTFVNDEAIEEKTYLSAGDIVKIGNSMFKIIG